MLIWKTNSIDLKIASFRYRCLLPSRYLKLHGYKSYICSKKSKINFQQSDIIIFVKSFTSHDLYLSQEASKAGIPIILDICDNIFIDEYTGGGSDIRPSEIFKQMSSLASAIVTTGVALRDVVEIEVGKHIPIFTIPDGNETLKDIKENIILINVVNWKRFAIYKPKVDLHFLTGLPESLKHKTIKLAEKSWVSSKKYIKKNIKLVRKSWFSLKESIKKNLIGDEIDDEVKVNVSNGEPINEKKVKVIVPSSPKKKKDYKLFVNLRPLIDEEISNSKKILWFGNQGANYGNFGMLNILDIAEHLIKLSLDIEFTLVVISNNYETYHKHIHSLPFSTKYIDWNPIDIYHYISISDVTILPNSKSPFSICKSANRAIMSLSLGVPVVATKTPALIPFEECTIVDNWEQGLRSYLTDKNLVKTHVKKAQSIIQEKYSSEAIANQWNNVLNQIIGNQI